MNAATIRRYLQPAATLRWHPWAPLVAMGLFIAFVFAFGAAWGFSVAKRMSDEQRVSLEPWTYTRSQVEAMRPARSALDAAHAFDAAVMRGARNKEAGKSLAHRLRISLEDAVFSQAWEDPPNPRRAMDIHEIFGDNARIAAEYRLANLAGDAPVWKNTARLCDEMGPSFDMRAQLANAAAAYSTVLGRTVTPEQLAPLSGARCS